MNTPYEYHTEWCAEKGQWVATVTLSCYGNDPVAALSGLYAIVEKSRAES
jgi:hypothetical protein